jgi:hypothetical protein
LLIPEKFWDDKDRQTQTDRKKSPHYKRRHLLSDFGRSGKPNFPVSRMRNAACVLHLRRDAPVLIWLNRG